MSPQPFPSRSDGIKSFDFLDASRFKRDRVSSVLLRTPPVPGTFTLQFQVRRRPLAFPEDPTYALADLTRQLKTGLGLLFYTRPSGPLSIIQFVNPSRPLVCFQMKIRPAERKCTIASNCQCMYNVHLSYIHV